MATIPRVSLQLRSSGDAVAKVPSRPREVDEASEQRVWSWRQRDQLRRGVEESRSRRGQVMRDGEARTGRDGGQVRLLHPRRIIFKGPNGGNALFLQDAESVRPGRDGGHVRWVRSRDEGGMNGSDFLRDRLDEATYVSLAV